MRTANATFVLCPPPSYLFNHPSIGAGVVFLVFAGTMVLQLLFVAFMMPETKGNRDGTESTTRKLIELVGKRREPRTQR